MTVLISRGLRTLGISDRDCEAVVWACEGLSNSEIAEKLKLRPRQVRLRLHSARVALEIVSREQLILKCLSHITVEDVKFCDELAHRRVYPDELSDSCLPPEDLVSGLANEPLASK